VTAHAVRRWQAIDREAPRDFDEASDALIETCAAIWWTRYADGEREPEITRTGAYLYQAGETHGRIRLVVVPRKRPEGPKGQVVDVVPRHGRRR